MSTKFPSWWDCRKFGYFHEVNFSNQLKPIEEETNRAIGRGRLKSRKLSDWKTFVQENFNPGEKLYGIDPDRQIFQVESAQDQVEIKPGIVFKNATINQAIDAETGDLLYVTVTAPIPGVTPVK